MITLSSLSVEWLSAGLVLLIAVTVLWLIRRAKTSAPHTVGTDAILAALEREAIKAVALAEKLAAGAILDGKAVFDAIDKKAVADYCYDLLPGTIHVDGVALSLSWVKARISQAQWEELVARVSGEIDAQFDASAGYLAGKAGKG